MPSRQEQREPGAAPGQAGGHAGRRAPTLLNLLSGLSALKGRTLVTFHSLGDADAANSAVVIRDLVQGLSKSACDVKSPDQVGGHARKILERLGVSVEPAGSLSGYSNIVFMDVSTRVLLGARAAEFAAFPGKTIVVDHHQYNTALLRAGFSYIDGGRSSSCEIVYQLMRLARRRPTPLQATLLLAGILADTALFKNSDQYTFEAAAYLLKHSGKTYREALDLVFAAPDFSQRAAALKAVQRAAVQKINGLLVAVSESNAFDLDCAAGLVGLGCDYAFVGSRREGRISGAKRGSLNGIGIGLIMERAGKAMKGSGGGHENVGGASGKPALLDAGLAECVEAVKACSGK
ncbi:MAG: DHH family phosphoesterase [Candidatus Micrarchaeota archaeon]|nr:DHH family phosphoesterase [Candidatus Micrarchaeota archaeon]